MTMYDSTNAWDIPANAEAVAGYDDGEFAWPEDRWLAWAHLPVLHITVEGNPASDCIDNEPGNLGFTPEQRAQKSAAWAANKVANHEPAVIYSDLADKPFLDEALADVGHHFGDHTWPDAGVYWWPADWPQDPNSPGFAHLYPAPGVVATQYAHPPGSGGHFDVSATIHNFPKPVEAPPAPPIVDYPGVTVTRIDLLLFQLDADGWYATVVELPTGKTAHDIVSVMPDQASAYDPQSWQFCQGGVDFASGSEDPDEARLVFHGPPNGQFTARVFVA